MADDLTRDQKEAERAAEEQAAVIAAALVLALLSLRPRMSVVMWWIPDTWADFADDVAKAIAPASKAHDRAARAVWLGYDPLDEATVAAEAAAREKAIRDIVDNTRKAVEKVVAWGQMNGVTGDDLSAILEKVAGINANQAGPLLDIWEKAMEGGAAAEKAAKLLVDAADKAVKDRAKTLTGDLLWDAVQAGRMAAGKQEQRATNAVVTKRWVTQRDELVCSTCGPLDGVTVHIADPFPGGFMMPKAHASCRCHTEITVSEEGMF
ncbi:phage minor head protein [Azospirillum sp. A26]|uniref:phage minor head protein n=1 Tax=Azospirillum sp. A26 TaxID=3160607 RepID=UPI00366C5CAE